jgi:hypothetical protein
MMRIILHLNAVSHMLGQIKYHFLANSCLLAEEQVIKEGYV